MKILRSKAWIECAALCGALGVLGGCAAGTTSTTEIKPDVSVTEPAKDAATKVALSPALLTAGADYYGATNTETLTYEVTDATGKKNDGTQTATLSEISDASAKLTVLRKDIVNPGESSDEILVKSDGVYAVATGGQKFTKPTMELPADPTVGKKWTLDTEVSSGGQQAKMSGTMSIVGTEKLTTPAGTFDALVVSLQGSIKVKDQTMSITGKSWYAKGVGLIKQELTQKQAGSTMKIQSLLKKRG